MILFEYINFMYAFWSKFTLVTIQSVCHFFSSSIYGMAYDMSPVDIGDCHVVN